MLIIPAIDIFGGECVRLYKGNYSQATVYDKDPVAAAREFERAGAQRLHIVDLDAARGGSKRNRKKIRKIRKAVSCTIQLGGGIRDEDDVAELIDLGIDRLVVGTIFVRNTSRVEGWIQHHGPIFVASIDSLDGKVRVDGWENATEIPDVQLARRAKEIGITSLIYTSISQDGTLEGPDVESTKQIAEASNLPVILSGGISSEDDIKQVIHRGDGKIVGIITGKAVYESRFDLEKVFQTYQKVPKESATW